MSDDINEVLGCISLVIGILVIIVSAWLFTKWFDWPIGLEILAGIVAGAIVSAVGVSVIRGMTD